MAIQDFNFVAFIDDSAGSAAALATQCGFQKQATHAQVAYYTAGHATWLIHPARNQEEQALLDLRGAAPYLIGLQSDNALSTTTSVGLPPVDTHALHPYLHIRKTPTLALNPQTSDRLYTGIDHCAIACARGTVDAQAHQLTEAFGLIETYRLNVDDGNSGMQSVVMASTNGKIRLPMIEPDGDTSQVQTFLDQARGMGIQHVGLATDNIIETVRHLQQNGVRFLKIKSAYYDSDDFQSMPLNAQDKAACRELNILADQNEQGGYLLQIFSEPCLGPMMIEIIERHHHNTFGARNIKSLFDTVADYQHAHAGQASYTA